MPRWSDILPDASIMGLAVGTRDSKRLLLMHWFAERPDDLSRAKLWLGCTPETAQRGLRVPRGWSAHVAQDPDGCVVLFNRC